MYKFLLTSLSLLLLGGCGSTGEPPTSPPQAGALQSWVLNGFEKVDSINPILAPRPEQTFLCPVAGREVRWEERNVLNPAAVVKDGKVHLFYRAQYETGTSRIGLAVSADGLHFQKETAPVLYPAEDDMKVYEWNYRKGEGKPTLPECPTCFFDGVEDPRIVERNDGLYVMAYTSYDGKTARLSLASSADLRTWTKHGLVLRDEEFSDYWSKSGAIVAETVGNRQVARKIDGKYWMYFGDTDLFLATSDDLIRWEPCRSAESGKLISVLHPRPGYFDSRLVEPGPYALLRPEGIVLIYNGSNAANFSDPALPKFTYAAGQALFDREAPYRQIDRTQGYFIHPDKDYEKVGEVNEVCFVEGLVRFQDQWFLYYGTADSKIAVAVSAEE